MRKGTQHRSISLATTLSTQLGLDLPQGLPAKTARTLENSLPNSGFTQDMLSKWNLYPVMVEECTSILNTHALKELDAVNSRRFG